MPRAKCSAVIVACAVAAAFPSVASAIVPPRGAGDQADREPAEGDAGRMKNGAARRPGAAQLEKPEEEEDERLVDPEAARRAQFFGDMPPLPFPMPFPQFPPPGVPVPPPQGGAAFGQAFGFSSRVVGVPGNGGAQAMVVEQWVLGPDGWVRQPPPGDVAPDAGGNKRAVGEDPREGQKDRGANGGRRKKAAKGDAAARKPAAPGEDGRRAAPRAKQKNAGAAEP